MRVFVTGSTGFVGTAVVKELLSAGHTVLGLTRSDKGAEQLKSQGAEAIHGTIEDLDLLRKATAECDGVIHLAFGGSFADFAGACARDQAAIKAMGTVLAAAAAAGDCTHDPAMVVTSGTMVLTRGILGNEDDGPDMANPIAAARGPAEPLCLGFASQGVRASVVRLAPTTHGPGHSGFLRILVGAALRHGVSASVGDGQNHWSAGHRDDAAKLYRLALESAQPGSVFHATAEEGVLVKDIATEVGKQLGLPVTSIPPEKAADHFNGFQFAVMADNLASSAKTKERLGWTPTGTTVIGDVPAVIDFMKSQAT